MEARPLFDARPLAILFDHEPAPLKRILGQCLAANPMTEDVRTRALRDLGAFARGPGLPEEEESFLALASRAGMGRMILRRLAAARVANAIELHQRLAEPEAALTLDALLVELVPLITLVGGGVEDVLLRAGEDASLLTEVLPTLGRPWESNLMEGAQINAYEYIRHSDRAATRRELKSLAQWQAQQLRDLEALVTVTMGREKEKGQVPTPPLGESKVPPPDTGYFVHRLQCGLAESVFRVAWVSLAYRRYHSERSHAGPLVKGRDLLLHIMGVAFPLFTLVHKALRHAREPGLDLPHRPQNVVFDRAARILVDEWNALQLVLDSLLASAYETRDPRDADTPALLFFYERTLRALVLEGSAGRRPGPVEFRIPRAAWRITSVAMMEKTIGRAAYQAWLSGDPLATRSGTALTQCAALLGAWATDGPHEAALVRAIGSLADLRMAVTTSVERLSQPPRIFTTPLSQAEDLDEDGPSNDYEALYAVLNPLTRKGAGDDMEGIDEEEETKEEDI